MANKKVFKLSTKKIDESSRYIIAKGDGLKLPIAEYGWERKYYAPSGSRIRSKIKKFWYMQWDTKNLSKIFGTKATISNSYNLIRHVPVKEWVWELNELAKKLKVNIKFE